MSKIWLFVPLALAAAGLVVVDFPHAAGALLAPVRDHETSQTWTLGTTTLHLPTITPQAGPDGDAVLSPGSVPPGSTGPQSTTTPVTSPAPPTTTTTTPLPPSTTSTTAPTTTTSTTARSTTTTTTAPTTTTTTTAPTTTTTTTNPAPSVGTRPAYSKMALWVTPHEDDEGGLWADQLDNDSSTFPVFVYMTNGENTGFCTNDTPIEYAPTGALGTEDRPPFNWPGDLTGSPGGFVGEGPPPEYFGAQGDDPPVFPRDPDMNPTTGWSPLLRAGSYSGAAGGTNYTEGFDGPCRASRLAAMTMMFSQENTALSGLSPRASGSRFPSVTPGQPPDGQVCFRDPNPESYRTGAGSYATPHDGASWTSAAVPAGQASPKDPCAYYWLTPTGDVMVFDLGDQSVGYRSACPYDEGDRLSGGGVWPDETIGFDSMGSYPAGARPGDASGCPGDLPDGSEAYTASPSDADWMVQQVFSSGLLPPGLPLAAVNGSAYVDGFNQVDPTPAATGPGAGPGAPGSPGPGPGPLGSPPSPAGGTASIDVDDNHPGTSCYWLMSGGSSCAATPPPAACTHYLHPNHLAVGLALRWNRPLPVVTQFSALCTGDPASAHTFGTTDPADGAAFWSGVFNNDGSGRGWEGAYQAYAWDTGLTAFDPYGNVASTCPGSGVPESEGQGEYTCEEAVSELGGAGAPTPPGDEVRGMRNTYRDSSGEGFTYPL